jgi:two-component sensor histidine kinase
MNETRKPTRWRTFAIKMTVLLVAWTALAALFAAQFYWIGRGLPLRISWKQAFVHSFTEWFPWLILSPLVVWLAERFRFDRARWLSGVLPHLPACAFVALAYHGISVLLMQYTSGNAFRSGVGQVFGSDSNFQSVVNLPGTTFTQPLNGEPGNQGGRGAVLSVDQGGVVLHFEASPVDGFSSTSMPAFGVVTIASPLAPGAGGFTPPFLPAMPGPWTRFFHAVIGRAQYLIPIYWAIVCVTWVVSYHQQLRERERRTLELEARLTQANLQTLKAQLQPHFLFNTLNAIASFIRKKPDAAEDMLASLSDFLRMNLDAAHQHEVALRREIEFLDLYLEIQQTRFGERLRVQKVIDPAALDVAVPTLILQPLVENSIRHGIEPRETGGTILIRAVRRGDALRLEVSDDGEGFKGGQLAALQKGVGLSNTKARLQGLYSDSHRFQITPNPGGGLTVAVELPWREPVAKRASAES